MKEVWLVHINYMTKYLEKIKKENNMKLTKKETERLQEIEAKALQNYLDYSENYLGDWVDDEDIEEYARLTEKD
jgi:hypothetical protein